jgi:hypothetical protein
LTGRARVAQRTPRAGQPGPCRTRIPLHVSWRKPHSNRPAVRAHSECRIVCRRHARALEALGRAIVPTGDTVVPWSWRQTHRPQRRFAPRGGWRPPRVRREDPGRRRARDATARSPGWWDSAFGAAPGSGRQTSCAP